MAGVVAGEGVGDADDGPLERVVRVAHRLDEGLAQKQREPLVAVGREVAAHAARLLGHRVGLSNALSRRSAASRGAGGRGSPPGRG